MAEPDAKSSSWTVPGADGIEVVVLATAALLAAAKTSVRCFEASCRVDSRSPGRDGLSSAPAGQRENSIGFTAPWLDLAAGPSHRFPPLPVDSVHAGAGPGMQFVKI